MNAIFLPFLLGIISIGPTLGLRCNEVQCASVVSKCMLTQACKCQLSRDPSKCTCCLDCAKCLGHMYQSCCSCLKMCEEEILELDPNDSQVGDLPNPFEELFQTIMKEKKEFFDGDVVTFSVDKAIDEFAKKINKNTYKDPANGLDQGSLPKIGVDCTVAYLKQCHSASKCRERCDQLGAGSYRYFFDGCCECVGSTCLNYGLKESRCRECPNIVDEYYDTLNDDSALADNHFEEDLTI